MVIGLKSFGERPVADVPVWELAGSRPTVSLIVTDGQLVLPNCEDLPLPGTAAAQNCLSIGLRRTSSGNQWHPGKSEVFVKSPKLNSGLERIGINWSLQHMHFIPSILLKYIYEFVCPPHISETVAVRIMKLAHRPRIASTTITLISKSILLSILLKKQFSQSALVRSANRPIPFASVFPSFRRYKLANLSWRQYVGNNVV